MKRYAVLLMSLVLQVPFVVQATEDMTLEQLRLRDRERALESEALRTSGGQRESTTNAVQVLPEDSDDDGMPDTWETDQGLNPNDPNDAWLDPDGDRVLNLFEFQLGGDPHSQVTPPVATVAAAGANFTDLEIALDFVSPGTVIRVAGGTYKVNYTTFDPAVVMIQGGWSPDFSQRDLKLHPTTLDGDMLDCVLYFSFSSGENAVILDGVNIIEGYDFFGAVNLLSSGTAILRTSITDCSITESDSSYGSGAVLWMTSWDSSVSDRTLANTTVADNDTGATRAQITGSAFARWRILNSTISDNRNSDGDDNGYGIHAFTLDTAVLSAHVWNSILWGNAREAVSISRNITFDVDHADVDTVDTGSGAVYQPGAGMTNVNPLFADVGEGDFHLQRGSPLIDRGIAHGIPRFDFEGDVRVAGAAPDMGADECVLDDLQVTPGTGFDCTGYVGGPFSPSNMVYTLVNAGISNLAWTASWTSTWVDVMPDTGLLASGESNVVTVSINATATGLDVGTYGDAVGFSNTVSGFVNSRTVELIVLPIPGEIEVVDSVPPNSDTNMPFGEVVVGLSRTEQITVTNSHLVHPLVITGAECASADEGFVLEDLPALPYTLAAGSNLTFDVVYAPDSLESNATVVVIESNDANEPEVEVALSGVGVPDWLSVTPVGGFDPRGHPGGPFSPSNTTYTLRNVGSVSVDWTVIKTAAWLNVVPAGGALATGSMVDVVASLTSAADALGEGVHADTLVFSNLTTGITQGREVRLTIFTSPEIWISPGSFRVTNALGEATSRLMAIGNAVGADSGLDFSLSTRDLGNGVLAQAAAAAGLPPVDRDFTRVQAGAAYEPERLLVRFAPQVLGAHRVGILAAALPGAEVERTYRIVPGLCRVKLGGGATVEQALMTVNKAAGVLYAEPDYEVQADAVPNDARFSDLWGMHNTGQTGGWPDADIDAPEAWEVNTGSRDIVVAVIDTGVDYGHEDLSTNMWRNGGEIPGNSVDDDGNGYVDDVYGYDFYNGDGDPMDDNNHGTHCAGTIGGAGNNVVGVAGVCWQVRIMALKFLSSFGSGSSSDAISCIEYAVQMGAKVLSNSWGGGSYNQALKDAIDAAGAAGIVFVAAAGNSGDDNDLIAHYPSSYTCENIIAVMATDRNDGRSVWPSGGSSCYGATSVDIGAPGSSILSCKRGGGYVAFNGTSMATPHVAGACALLLSHNPALTVAQMKETLLWSVDVPTTPLACVSEGRMNVRAALAAVGAEWLTVSPESVTNVPPGTATNIVLHFDAGELQPGSYTGQIDIACNDLGIPQTNVPCVMIVLPEDLRVTPGEGLISSGHEGGPFTPSNQVYSLTNTGGSELTWFAQCSSNWVSVTPTNGILVAGGMTEVTVTISTNANGLGIGTYDVAVAFQNMTSGRIQTRLVHLSVTDRPPAMHEFRVLSLLGTGSHVVDHNALTGDDRGGIAISDSHVFYSGDSSTARFSIGDLSGGTALGQKYDALVSDLRSGKVYSLATGLTPLGSAGGSVTTLLIHDPATGTATTNTIALSAPISLPASGGDVGIFAGYGRVLLHTGSRVFAILLPTGLVQDLGPMASPTHRNTENWAYWGVAEYYGGTNYIVYVQNSTTIARTAVPGGTSTTLATFANVSDMACITVSVPLSRWYFHHEGSSQFGGTSETIGYADATYLIGAMDDLSVTPAGGLSSEGYQDGPFMPSNKVYALTNEGGSNLTWSASWSEPWIEATPTNGVLAAGESTMVTVSLAAAAASLPPGKNRDTVVFSNVASGINQLRDVDLVILERVLDHFAWAPIAPTQYVGWPLLVEIRAEDQTGHVLKSFTNSVQMGGWVGTGEGAPISVIQSSSYESTEGWTDYESHPSEIAAFKSSNWSSDGEHSFGCSFWSDDHHDIGDYGCFRQDVDWTEISTVKFDACCWNGDEIRARLLIGGSEVWSVQPSGASEECWYDVEVDVSHISGNQVLELRTEASTSGSWFCAFFWDNLRAYGAAGQPIAISPVTSGNLAMGVWTGNVTVLEVATNMYLHADDGSGHTGNSNPFDVLAGVPVTLTVVSAQGGAYPGTVTVISGSSVTQWVTNSPASGGSGVRYICTAGTVLSNDYTQVSPSNVTLTVTNDATLTWQWQTQYALSTHADGSGVVTSADGWYASGSGTVLGALAEEPYWHFAGWSGDTNGCPINGNVLLALMTQARSIAAMFAANDSDGDGMSDWAEAIAGTSATDSNEYFKISGCSIDETGNMVIYWDSVTGRWYTVYLSTNLMSGHWTDVHQTAGGGNQACFTNETSVLSPPFVRLGVRLDQ